MIQKSINSLCILLFFVNLSYGQQMLTGKVSAADTGNALPFAGLYSGATHLGTTDMQGSFSLAPDQWSGTLSFTYPGYQTQQLSPSKNKPLEVSLNPLPGTVRPQEIEAAIARGNQLMKRAISQKRQNLPETLLDSYSFNSYQKSLITADPDSINGEIDSIYRMRKDTLALQKIDSGNYRLKKQMLRTHLYLTETAIEVNYDMEKGKKRAIVANQMAGLEEPLVRLLKFQLQSFSFYNERFTLLGTLYKSPLAENALKTYNYRILDTVPIQGRPGYLVYFFPRKKTKKNVLEGVLYLDTLSLALQKGSAQLRGGLEVNAGQEFEYFPEEDLWFPVHAKMRLKKGDGDEPVELFDRMIIKVNESSSDSSLIHSNTQFPDRQLRYHAEQTNSEITFKTPVSIRPRAKDIEVYPDAAVRGEPFWNTRRAEPLTDREVNTYNELDSIALATHINERLAFLNKLFTGYLTTRYIDFDLKYLIKYNNYEAFRLGMGAITNNNFSDRFRLKAYGVYGTKDDDFKYGFTGSMRLSPSNKTWLSLDYTDDLVETGSAKFLTEGRTFYVFEPRLFNITSFHRNKALSTYITHDFNPALRTRLQWTNADTQPTYPYFYALDGELFSNYITNTATFSVYWAPNNTYLTSRGVNKLLAPGFPQFNLQFTQGFKGVMGSDFNFTKTQVRIRHRINTYGAGAIDLNMTGGLAFGDLPITELYHASPNQPKAEALLSRFSVAGRDSFETMYFDEFFSDRYISLQAKYLAPPFKITEKINPQVIFITRFAIGDIRNIENHIGIPFRSLEQGYYESGLEFNNIFSGFGLSTMYRYGPYQLPLFTDNVSFKFTFYLSLGI